jgi:hypothetical protein
MKFMTTWAVQPGAVKEAVSRFLATGGQPLAGVTLLGRWHNLGCSSGYTLYETDNPAALYEGAAKWSDLMDVDIVPVIEDESAGAALARVFGK